MVKPNIRYIFVRTNSNTMDYKVLTSNYAEGLTTQVKSHIDTGWKPVGSHQVVINHVQNRYSGPQFMDSLYKSEYSQTMIKD